VESHKAIEMKKSNFAALLKKARDLEVKATQPDEQLKCTDNCGCVLGGEYAMICGKGKRSDSVMLPHNTYHFCASVVTSKPQLPSKSALKPSSSVPELLVDVVRTDSNASNSSARNRVTFLSAQVDTGAKGGLYGTSVYLIASLLVLTITILHFRQRLSELSNGSKELSRVITIPLRSFRPWNKCFPTVRASSIVIYTN